MKSILMILHFGLTLLTLYIPFISIAQPCIDDSILIPKDSTIKIGRLSNGLTYYLKYNNWPEKRACFYLAQRVSLQEDDSQRGLAHFLEHMCFNGSEHFHGNGVDRFFNRGDEIDAWHNECGVECQYVIMDDLHAICFPGLLVAPLSGLDDDNAKNILIFLSYHCGSEESIMQGQTRSFRLF